MALPGSSDWRRLAWIIQLFAICGVTESFKVIEKPVNQTGKIGETVVLRCTVEPEDGEQVHATWIRKDVGALWLGGDRSLDGWRQYSIIGDGGKGEHHLQIKPLSLKDDQEFQCQVRPDFRAAASVSVLVPPTNITLESLRSGTTTEIYDGSTVEVTCAVLGGKPEAQILWYRNEKLIEEGISMSIHTHKDKTVDTRARLNFQATPADHKAHYTCRALHPALPQGSSIRTNFTLSVIYPPSIPVITGYSENEIVTAGEKKKLHCEVTNGNPFPEVLWYRNEKRIDSSFHNQPDITVNDYEFFVNHEDDGAEYKCMAKNLALATTVPLFSSVTLKVYYAPSKVEIKGKLEGRAGQKIHLQCMTAPSRPAASVQWIINGRPESRFTTALRDVPNSSGKVTVSNVTVELDPNQRKDVSVTCSARNEELQRQTGTDNRLSTTADISVQYPPSSLVLYGDTGSVLRAVQQLLLTCVAEGGKPAPTIHWFKGKSRRRRKNKLKWKEVTEGVGSSRNENGVQSELRFRVRATDNRAHYRCEARSPALNRPLRDSANLTVYFPPKDVNITVASSTKKSHLKAGDFAQLECASGSGNPAPILSWYDEGGTALSSKITQSGTGENFGHTVKNKLYVPLDASKDGATYTCRAENREIDTMVSKSVTLSVHYPPQFLVDEARVLTVRENESVAVNVTARAKPAKIHYRWTKVGSKSGRVRKTQSPDGGVWAKGPLLLADTIKRTDAGTYLVYARNSEGTTNTTLNITVKYPAYITKQTDPVVAEIGEDVSLECEADAYPVVSRMVHWENREDFDMSKTIQTYGDKKATLRIKSVQKNHSGIFYCEASNGIGTPAMAEVSLLVRQAPEVDNAPKYRKAAGKVGGPAVLRCRAVGAPAVDINWFRMGKKLESIGQRVTVSERKTGLMTFEGTIEILRVEREDYGMYSCTAENELGKHQMEVELVMVGPPNLPENLKLINVSGTSVELGWKPGFDGGMPQSFQIRYRVLGVSKHELVNVKPADATRYTLRDLKPFTRYSFSIGARNRVGFSGYSDEDGVVVETYGRGDDGVWRGKMEESSPLLMIILICIVGVVLLVLNLCLLCCCIKRVRRKKLRAEAAKERIKHVTIQSPTSSVQMYGPDVGSSGLRPDSQYSDHHHNKGHSEFSEDEQSVRTVIEVDATGQPVFRADRISPGTYQTYLVDDPCTALMPYDYADIPSGANYAETLRNNSLQRRIAAGQYSPTPAYPESGYPGESVEDPVPPPMGPLRTLSEELNQYAPYPQYSPARTGLLRRYSPNGVAVSPPPVSTPAPSVSSPSGAIPTVVQSTGITPYAEVRPIVTAHNGTNNTPFHPNNSMSRVNGSPVLSTFSAGYSNTKPKQEYLDMEELSGDLV